MTDTTATDSGLEVMREAAALVEKITDGKTWARAYQHEERLFIRAEPGNADPILFQLRCNLSNRVWAYTKDVLGCWSTSHCLAWSGAWTLDNRPLWTPESVAGLVLATIGMFGDQRD